MVKTMVASVISAIVLTQPMSAIEVRLVPLEQLRASHFIRIRSTVVEELMPGVRWFDKGSDLLDGPFVRPSNDNRSLLVSGSKESIDKFEQVVGLLDVAPVRIRYEVTINNSIEGTKKTFSVTEDNAGRWRFESTDPKFTIEGEGRVTEVGTLNVTFQAVNRFAKTRGSATLKPGETYTFGDATKAGTDTDPFGPNPTFDRVESTIMNRLSYSVRATIAD